MLRFTREMIALRKRHPSLGARGSSMATASRPRSGGTARRSRRRDWDDPEARVLCFTLLGREAQDEPALHVMINMSGATVAAAAARRAARVAARSPTPRATRREDARRPACRCSARSTGCRRTASRSSRRAEPSDAGSAA